MESALKLIGDPLSGWIISTLLLLILLLLAHGSGNIYKRAKVYGTRSNRRRTGCLPIFDDAEKQRFVDLLTRDARTRRLTWEAICMEMEMELGEIWGRVGDIEVLEACLPVKAAWGSMTSHRSGWIA